MIGSKIITLLLCAILKLIGEKWWHNAQRYIMPLVIVGQMLLIDIASWNKLAFIDLASLIMIWPLTESYKAYSRDDYTARGWWEYAVCFAAWIVPAYRGKLYFDIWFVHVHNSWMILIPYLAASWFLGAWLRNKNNTWGAPCNGLIIGFPILMYH